jgi:hypothetical protein
MATIEDKLTAEVVPLKPFTYELARSALQAHPRQKNEHVLYSRAIKEAVRRFPQS